MMDRRTVLKLGAAASAATLLPGFAVGAPGAGSGVRIERFVFDERFAEAIAKGRDAGETGIPISGVDGDLTRLWYDDLSLRWQRKPMALAGLTAEDALFVLGTLAPAYRMRVVEETEWGIARTIGSGPVSEVPLYSWVIAPTDRV